MTFLTTPEPQPLPAWLLAERQGWNCVGPGSDWDWLAWLDEIEMADARWFDQHGEAAAAAPERVLHVVPFRLASPGQPTQQGEEERHAAA